MSDGRSWPVVLIENSLLLGTACENLDANTGKICLFWDSLPVYWLTEFKRKKWLISRG